MSVICTYMSPTFMTHAAMCPLEVNVCPVYTLSACTGHGMYTVDTGPTSPTPMHCAHFGMSMVPHTKMHIHSALNHPLCGMLSCAWICVYTQMLPADVLCSNISLHTYSLSKILQIAMYKADTCVHLFCKVCTHRQTVDTTCVHGMCTDTPFAG